MMGMEAKIDFSFPVAVAVIFFLIVMGIGALTPGCKIHLWEAAIVVAFLFALMTVVQVLATLIVLKATSRW
jgi:hypothetical protein